MRAPQARTTALARCASPWPKEIFSPGTSYSVMSTSRCHVSGGRDTRVDVFQKCKPCLLWPPLDESDIENNEIVSVMHSDERRRMQKAVLRQLEDQLVEIFGRHAKCIHQSGLYGPGYLGDPGLVVTALDKVNPGKRHGMGPCSLTRFSPRPQSPALCPDRRRCKA